MTRIAFVCLAGAAVIVLGLPGSPARPSAFIPDARTRTPAAPPMAAGVHSPTPKPDRSLQAAAVRAASTVRTAAHGLVLPPEALAVRWCESRHDYSAQNPTSSASGAWQFIDSTWRWVTGLRPPASAHPREVQDQAFVDLWDGGRGASHWEASAWCWRPLVEQGVTP